MIATGTLKVRIDHDQDTESPADAAGQWTFYSFNHRHGDFKHPDDLDTKETRQKLRRGLAWVLSCYEHGGIVWWIQGDAGHPACPFDTTHAAGMLVWEHDADDMANPRHGKIASRKADAQAFLDVWNAWVAGECYWYSVEDEDGNTLDSCGGFIGDPERSGMLDAIKSAVGEAPVVFTGDAAHVVKDDWPDESVVKGTD